MSLDEFRRHRSLGSVVVKENWWEGCAPVHAVIRNRPGDVVGRKR